MMETTINELNIDEQLSPDTHHHLLTPFSTFTISPRIESPPNFRGGCINIRGFHRISKQYLVAEALWKLRLDFLIITETWMNEYEFKNLRFLKEDRQEKDSRRVFEDYRLYHSGLEENRQGRGVGIFIQKSLARHIQEVWSHPGRILLLQLAFYKYRLVLGGVQMP